MSNDTARSGRAPRGMSLYKLLSMWLEDRSTCCARRTMIQYEFACRTVLVPSLGHMPIGAVTRAHVLAMHGRNAETPAKANQGVVTGRMAWTFAEDRGLVAPGRNPFHRIKPHPTSKSRNPISPTQAAEVWIVCENAIQALEAPCAPVHGAYFVLLLLTGLRRGEAAALRWSNVELELGALYLTEHKTARSSGVKMVALSSAAVDHLRRIKDFGWSDVWVFPSLRSSSGHIEDPHRAWERVREAAGCVGVRLHDLRRGYASMLHSAGHDIRTIASLLGHASIVTTEKYIRPSLEGSRRASDTVAASIRQAGAAASAARGLP